MTNGTSAAPKVSWFGRDPAAFVTTLSAAVVAMVALLPGIPDGLAAAVGAAVTMGGGIVIAVVVLRDGQVAAIVGFFKAGFVVLVLLGWHVDPAQQALVLVAVEAIGALIVRPVVRAPVDSNGYRRDKYTGLSEQETTLQRVA
jgi:hypothetical protein